MTDQSHENNFSTPQQNEPEVLVLIRRMQQQLTFLERKIDTLINQSQVKPAREKTFSKPFRSFDRPSRPGHFHGKGGQEEYPQERSFHHPSHRHSPKRHGDEHREFGGKKRGFDPKKKFSFHKRKDRSTTEA